MQVAHSESYVTHAVIGGGKTASFGISDSAEFFNILSNTLYSDKIGAVGREVLCNAWDILIETGRTHLPVVITLTDGVLTIRDHGTGIARDMMVERYCVYGGGSTKTLDGRQTGGFSLGCKAPFAYVDHFEVTSFHKGVKTIYQLSKSSGEVGGKPGLTEIISVPTDEHGLQVKIDVKQQDTARFVEVLNRIARVGEMNATINGRTVQTLPFSENKHGFLIIDEPMTVQKSSSRIFVRYGNVAYPVEEHDQYKANFRNATSFMDTLKRDYVGNPLKLVLVAQPDTISVTPSRESLSMTDLTVDTLASLLAQFWELQEKEMQKETFKRAEERTELAWMEMTPAVLLDGQQTLFKGRTYRHYTSSKPGPAALSNFEEISKAYVAERYPNYGKFWQRDVEMRLRTLIEGGFGGRYNRGKLQSFLADFTHPQKPSKDTNWFHKRLAAPLLLALKNSTEMSPARLVAYANFEERHVSGKRYRYNSGPSFTEVAKFSEKKLDDYLPYLRNLVILTYNRISIEERASQHPAFKHHFGSPLNSLVYMVQRNERRVEAARAFFKSQGIYVVDLTRPYTGELASITTPDSIREYKPRKKGIPVLKSILPTGSRMISTDLFKAEDAERIEQPEFVIKIAARENKETLDDYNSVVSQDIIHLYGSKGGIVVNQSQLDKYKIQGAQDFLPWVIPQLMEEIQTNSRILAYLANDYSRKSVNKHAPLSHVEMEILNIIRKDGVLKIYFNVDGGVTDEDMRYIRLWRHVENTRTKEIIDFSEKYLNTIPISSDLMKLCRQLQGNRKIYWLESNRLVSDLRYTGDNKDILQKQSMARDLLIWVTRS